MSIPVAHSSFAAQILKQILYEREIRTHVPQLQGNCGIASRVSKLFSPRRSAMKFTRLFPARLRPYCSFRNRQNTVEFPSAACCSNLLSRWTQVTLFVLVHVEVRVGHVCNECVTRLLEAQEVDDASCAWS